jgi:hypothetical protein
MNTFERKFAHTVFPVSSAAWMWRTRIQQGSDPGTRRPPTMIGAVRAAGAVFTVLALAAGTARASAAVTAANAARGFRRDMSGRTSSVPDGRGCRLSIADRVLSFSAAPSVRRR